MEFMKTEMSFPRNLPRSIGIKGLCNADGVETCALDGTSKVLSYFIFGAEVNVWCPAFQLLLVTKSIRTRRVLDFKK